jgi:RpiR family carbohydrate utilization transcriptional regulator
VIALTSPGSPLARMATVPIYANAREDAEIYSPMISRILHLTLIDVLAVGVALKRGPAVIQPLERTKQSLRTRKREAEDPS